MFRRLVILLLCICYGVSGYSQENPIDLPVSLLTGQVELSPGEDKQAVRKTGVKMLGIRQVRRKNGLFDTPLKCRAAFGRDGSMFRISDNSDEEAFNRITYDARGNLLVKDVFYSRLEGCGT